MLGRIYVLSPFAISYLRNSHLHTHTRHLRGHSSYDETGTHRSDCSNSAPTRIDAQLRLIRARKWYINGLFNNLFQLKPYGLNGVRSNGFVKSIRVCPIFNRLVRFTMCCISSVFSIFFSFYVRSNVSRCENECSCWQIVIGIYNFDQLPSWIIAKCSATYIRSDEFIIIRTTLYAYAAEQRNGVVVIYFSFVFFFRKHIVQFFPDLRILNKWFLCSRADPSIAFGNSLSLSLFKNRRMEYFVYFAMKIPLAAGCCLHFIFSRSIASPLMFDHSKCGLWNPFNDDVRKSQCTKTNKPNGREMRNGKFFAMCSVREFEVSIEDLQSLWDSWHANMANGMFYTLDAAVRPFHSQESPNLRSEIRLPSAIYKQRICVQYQFHRIEHEKYICGAGAELFDRVACTQAFVARINVMTNSSVPFANRIPGVVAMPFAFGQANFSMRPIIIIFIR